MTTETRLWRTGEVGQVPTDPDGVEVVRGEIETAVGRAEGWIARFDGTESVARSREGALRQLVVDVAKEGPL